MKRLTDYIFRNSPLSGKGLDAVLLIFRIFAGAMILAFNMLIACRYHWHDAFSTLSLPLLFFGIYCILSLTGGGRYSIDSLIFRKKR